MRRGKPVQEIYRPGSGPLRKSNTEIEESEPDIILKHNRPKPNQNDPGYSPTLVETHNQPRKPRKPEQELYVPRPVANAREMSQQDNDRQNNGNYDNDRFKTNSKRYSNRKRGGSNENSEYNEWRDKPTNNRQFRQGSEPRNVSNGQRMRDTRSVEPSNAPPIRNFNEKGYSKPPSGRRHSTIGLEGDKRHKPLNVEKLPPRLRKKLLEEGKFGGQPIEDNWNGASLTFQGSSNQNHPHNYPQYNTLPHRHRGRGRFVQDFDSGGAPCRARTPDVGVPSPCNSRPPTPPYIRTRSNDNLNRPDSRPQSPSNYPGGRNNDYRRYNGRGDRGGNRRGPFLNRNHREDRRNQNYQAQEEENWDDEPLEKPQEPHKVQQVESKEIVSTHSSPEENKTKSGLLMLNIATTILVSM